MIICRSIYKNNVEMGADDADNNDDVDDVDDVHVDADYVDALNYGHFFHPWQRAYNIQHTTYYIQHTTYSIQHPASKV